MPDVPAASSPTGKPLLPPKLVPYAFALWLALTGGGLALLPEGKWQKAGMLVSLVLAALLGIASPGLRKPAAVLLVLLLPLLPGCALFRGEEVQCTWRVDTTPATITGCIGEKWDGKSPLTITHCDAAPDAGAPPVPFVARPR